MAPATEAVSVFIICIVVSFLLTFSIPSKNQQKFWANILGQRISYAGGGKVATFIATFLTLIIGYILLRITPTID